MKKIKTLFTIILITTIGSKSFAQKNSICGEVYYKQATNFSMYYKRNFLMKFDNKSSYYEEQNIKITETSQRKEYSDQGLTNISIVERKNLSPEFFYSNKEDLYFREIWFDKSLLVKEPKLTFTWILQSDTRKIGKFICQKATTTFRGRNYIAWFTKEIPVPFGPWKFKNLPGLILEVYDTENVFHIVVVKINIGNNIDCTINVKKETLAKAMTITNYLEKRKQLLIDDFARLGSKMGRSKPLKLDENCDDCSESIEIFNKNN